MRASSRLARAGLGAVTPAPAGLNQRGFQIAPKTVTNEQQQTISKRRLPKAEDIFVEEDIAVIKKETLVK